jgi:hypothetical protein
MIKIASVIALMVLLCVSAVADENDWTGFGNLEGRAIKTLDTIDIGTGISLQLTTIPSAWPIIGGRKLFGDVDYATKNTRSVYFGGSISLAASKVDDGFRWGCAYCPSSNDTMIYLGKAFPFEW